MTTLEKIKAEIKNQLFIGRILNSKDFDDGLKWCLELIDKYAEQEPCENCCNGNQIEKAKLCQKSYLAGMEHKQELCEDEYIKIPKKALKYRTAGMVAYNAEWLKNHFNVERAVICGSQEPCVDTISRQEALDTIGSVPDYGDGMVFEALSHAQRDVALLPLVTPQQKIGQWIAYEVQLPDRTILNYRCSVCGRKLIGYNTETLSEAPYCHCGAKMIEPQERSGKE